MAYNLWDCVSHGLCPTLASRSKPISLFSGIPSLISHISRKNLALLLLLTPLSSIPPPATLLDSLLGHFVPGLTKKPAQRAQRSQSQLCSFLLPLSPKLERGAPKERRLTLVFIGHTTIPCLWWNLLLGCSERNKPTKVMLCKSWSE